MLSKNAGNREWKNHYQLEEIREGSGRCVISMEVAPLVSLIPFLLTPYSSTTLQCFLILPGAFGGLSHFAYIK